MTRPVFDLNGKRILVTGGAGFIGSHLVESLLKLGAQVAVYDNYDPFYGAKEENLTSMHGNQRLKVVKGDILDRELLSTAMKKAELVFHMAGQAGIRYCTSNPEKANQVNVTGTLNVLLAAKDKRVKKVVYASSSSVYGRPQKTPMNENHPLNPTNIYGATKLAAEKYCTSLGETLGLPVVCLRYFSAYGPRGRPDQVLHAFASRILDGQRPVIYGDGSQTRDFTYISDIVGATVLSALLEESNGQIMNVGYGREVKILDAARLVLEGLKSDLEVEFRDPYPGDFPRTLADNSRARSVLSWQPQVNLNEGLKLFLDWLRAWKGRGAREEAEVPGDSIQYSPVGLQ